MPRVPAALLAFAASIPILLATSAGQAGTVDLIWLSTTGTGTPGATTIVADPGDEIALGVYIDLESGESAAILAVSIEFDNDGADELDLVSAVEGKHAATYGCTPFPTCYIEFGPSLTNTDSGVASTLESTGGPGGTGGFVYTFEQGTLGTGPSGPVTIQMGEVTFAVTPNVATDGADIISGELNACCDGNFDNGSNPISLDFHSAAVDADPNADSDLDGIPDALDNCLEVYNPHQCDVDFDGYGGGCDGDFDGDGVVGNPDFNVFRANYQLSSVPPAAPAADLNCDGVVGNPDFNLFRLMFEEPVGPSGLACAGSAPCITTASNDACEFATPGFNEALDDWTSGDTSDGDASCGNSSGSPDAWFSVRPLVDGVLTVDTCDSTFDTVVSIHDACPGASNELACNDDSTGCGPGSTGSLTSVQVTAFEKVFVRVAGNGGSVGDFSIQIAVGPDLTPPTPDPMSFAGVAGTSESAIQLDASVASDVGGEPVEYFFEYTGVLPEGTSSAWQQSASYVDTGLTANTEYTYTVTARDQNGNETAPSPEASVYTLAGVPPTPDPMSFAAVAATSISEIQLDASIATDDGGLPVEYFFAYTGALPEGTSSGWQSSTTYTDTGLDPGTEYTYTVKARDQLGNETASSPASSVYTLALVPGAPISQAVLDTSMRVNVISGDNPPDVEYAIRCSFTTDLTWDQQYVAVTGASGNPGGISEAAASWRTELDWSAITETGLQPGTVYCWEAKARNGDGVVTNFGPTACAMTLP